MLRCDQQIRLTSREVERITKVTGFPPDNVKTLDALDQYIEACKQYYSGDCLDARFLRWLFDNERLRLTGGRIVQG